MALIAGGPGLIAFLIVYNFFDKCLNPGCNGSFGAPNRCKASFYSPTREVAESMGRLTTHVLDAAHGCPGNSIKVELYRVEGSQLTLVATAVTNSDGRCDAPLLEGDTYRSGVYQLQFSAGDYYRARGVQLPEPAFLDVVVLRFGISAEQDHYHVPLLISPYSYSTYRGS